MGEGERAVAEDASRRSSNGKEGFDLHHRGDPVMGGQTSVKFNYMKKLVAGVGR